MNMHSLQIRGIPEEVFAALMERARKHGRSVAQQAVADLAQISELETRRTRQALIERLRDSAPALPKKALDPVRIVQEDRSR